MKKTLLAITMVFSILLALPLAAGTPDQSTLATDTQSAIDPATKARLDAMLPVFDSVIRAASNEESNWNEKYSSTNPALAWNVLYHLAVNFGEKHPLVEVKDDAMKVPYQAMQEFATACFADYDDLVAPPAEFEPVRFDKEWNAFFLQMSDIGDSYCRIDSITPASEGKYNLKVSLVGGEDDEIISTRSFVVVPNTFATMISEPLYHYSVESVSAAQ